MTKIIDSNHKEFLFSDSSTFNVFNLLRLFRDYNEGDELEIDIRSLGKNDQSNILSKSPHFLELFKYIISNIADSVTIHHSVNDALFLQNLSTEFSAETDDGIIVFDTNSCNNLSNDQDPHLVKNVRGVVLLSLVQDLISIGTVKSSFSIFDENSPITLHAASIFLFNKDNASMVWGVLIDWEATLDDNIEINLKIHQAKQESNKINGLIDQAVISAISDGKFEHFYKNSLVSKLKIRGDFYDNANRVNLWFVDDQYANGWLQLIEKVLQNPIINIEPFNSVESVKQQIDLVLKFNHNLIPDLALVDLRLNRDDVCSELYNAEDLSGFNVVEMLLNQWSGLSIMIASASNKLWNMEKAIQKGAVAYWRKSDEITQESPKSAILTAFDIYIQFTNKFSTILKKMEYKFVFKIIEEIRVEISRLGVEYTPLKLVVDNYFDDLVQKTSWMCWRKEDSARINDGLYLGISTIYNEIENLLWDRSTGKLVLDPSQAIRKVNGNSDKLIINDSLIYMDTKYSLTGKALKEYYEGNKNIRNKLPTIHGSESTRDVKHAQLLDIESSLLIILCLVTELKNVTLQNKTP
ncbi:hypothetical protein [Vibrio cyclitrophicus]|uniref:hypothetical protein n=1 Tax=Vibrio cyclitrophicus TaxID=47951 RepID=UPI001055974D|nr:hypothetical protein [Vibrio cyclitrophicus]